MVSVLSNLAAEIEALDPRRFEGRVTGLSGAQATQVGTVNDQTYLYFDVGVGYWVYRNNCCDAFLTGIAPRFEAHYNTSVSDPDVVAFNRGTQSDPSGLGFAGQVASGVGDFVIWDSRTVSGSGVDVVFDLGADCCLAGRDLDRRSGDDLAIRVAQPDVQASGVH